MEDQRLAQLLDRVNAYYRRAYWYDRDRKATDLLDVLEMMLSRIESLEHTNDLRDQGQI